ncbi:MAG: preprotein translocase subunit SecG [bacterium]
MENYISIAQIAVSVVLIFLVLFQQRGTALGSAFGQEGGFYSTRRGIQQKLYVVTIILGFCFIALAILNLVF